MNGGTETNLAANGLRHGTSPTSSLCSEHSWTFRDIDGETWNICFRCGFGEQWARGLRFKTTDEDESARLDAKNAHLHDPPGAGWQE